MNSDPNRPKKDSTSSPVESTKVTSVISTSSVTPSKQRVISVQVFWASSLVNRPSNLSLAMFAESCISTRSIEPPQEYPTSQERRLEGFLSEYCRCYARGLVRVSH